MSFFEKTKLLEANIEHFFGFIQEASLHFEEGIKEYIHKHPKAYEKRLADVIALEKRANELRREIKYKLYSEMLIPESRGDVLALLETSDGIIDHVKKVLINFSAEAPSIPEAFSHDFLEMCEYTTKAIDAFVLASRGFFINLSSVNENINKVYFYEEEVDKVEARLKRKIFQEEHRMDFSHKVQLRYFAEKTALVSDIAEDVCERLSVFVIKRMY